jgi:hypothetical protein
MSRISFSARQRLGRHPSRRIVAMRILLISEGTLWLPCTIKDETQQQARLFLTGV